MSTHNDTTSAATRRGKISITMMGYGYGKTTTFARLMTRVPKLTDAGINGELTVRAAKLAYTTQPEYYLDWTHPDGSAGSLVDLDLDKLITRALQSVSA